MGKRSRLCSVGFPNVNTLANIRSADFCRLPISPSGLTSQEQLCHWSPILPPLIEQNVTFCQFDLSKVGMQFETRFTDGDGIHEDDDLRRRSPSKSHRGTEPDRTPFCPTLDFYRLFESTPDSAKWAEWPKGSTDSWAFISLRVTPP